MSGEGPPWPCIGAATGATSRPVDAPVSPRSEPGPVALVLGAVYGLVIVWLTDERNFYGSNSPGMSAFAALVFLILLGIVLLAVCATVKTPGRA